MARPRSCARPRRSGAGRPPPCPGSTPRNACLPRERRAARGDVLLRATGEEQVHPGDELAHEDGLREVVLDAQLEPADLVLDRLLAREKDDRDRRPLGALLELAHQGVPVELGQPRVAENEVRRERLDLGERIEPVCGRGDAVASLLQADFEHAHAPRIRVDEKQFLLGHRAYVGEHGRPMRGVSRPDAPRVAVVAEALVFGGDEGSLTSSSPLGPAGVADCAARRRLGRRQERVRLQ